MMMVLGIVLEVTNPGVHKRDEKLFPTGIPLRVF